jgi:enediyne biosynthesis protein E4
VSPRADRPTLLVLVVSAGLAACSPGDGGARSGAAASAGPPPWFREEARERGIDFVQHSGAAGGYRMPEIMCGGAALFDMDGDGDLDAYLVQSGDLAGDPAARSPNRLYENDGTGHFRDVTEGSGAGDRGYGNGVACGDFDNDGRTDLYVTNLGPNVLLHNLGGGRFEDVTARAGVGDAGWGTSAAFFDMDGDGDLDLFVCNYLVYGPTIEKTCLNPILGGEDYCSPNEYAAPAADVLYRNEGDGTFTDVSQGSGIAAAKGNGLGVVCGDFDGDGRTDLFVANDGMPDRLWLNRPDGTFADEALPRGCAFDSEGRASAGMGVAAADFDQDGDLDLLVCNLRNEPDSLYRNEGRYFANATAIAGLGATSRPFTRFGVGVADFDQDGLPDMYQANGRVVRHVDPWDEHMLYAEPNLVFRCIAPARFEELQPRGGTNPLLIATSRAAAFGDVDGDGAIDILIANMDAPAHLLINTVPNRGAWITFRLLDPHGRDALGARVTIEAAGSTRTSEARAAYSYQASNDPRVHFGLGPAQRIESTDVRWPDGTTESFGAFEPDQVVTLRQASTSSR